MTAAEAIALVAVLSVFIMKLVCFFVGYRIVRLGADLLREGVKGDFKFKTDFSGASADLASASPGLLFLLIGVVLIGYAMRLPKAVDLTAGGGSSTDRKPPVVALPHG